MDYEWNEAKAIGNFRKHGVSFTAAAIALSDPRKIELIDDRFDYEETRYQSICMGRSQILLVVTTMPDEDLRRIISARKATKYEQELYFENDPAFR